jgi:hypothetical protein
MRTGDDGTRVDVLSLEDFRTTLEGRLADAQNFQTKVMAQLDQVAPQLGSLPDATYVSGRYASLCQEHLDRLNVLINALIATKDALTTIITNYRTNEARLTANATDIAATLDEIGGSDGENAHAG